MIMYFKRILSQQNFDVFTACSEIVSSTNSTNSFQSFSNRPNDSSQLLTFWLLNFPVSISNTWCMKSANVYIPSGCICCRLKNVYFPFRPVFFWYLVFWDVLVWFDSNWLRSESSLSLEKTSGFSWLSDPFSPNPYSHRNGWLETKILRFDRWVVLFKCVHRIPTSRQYGQDLRATCLEK